MANIFLVSFILLLFHLHKRLVKLVNKRNSENIAHIVLGTAWKPVLVSSIVMGNEKIVWKVVWFEYY